MTGDTLHVFTLEVRVVQTSGRPVKPERIAQAVADHLRGEFVTVPPARSGKGSSAAVVAVEIADDAAAGEGRP